MQCEFLINKRNGISSVQIAPGIWGKKECLPSFTIITKDISSFETAMMIRAKFTYDFDKANFVSMADGSEYEEGDIILYEKYDSVEGFKQDQTLAGIVGVANACAFLSEHYGDETTIWIRKYYLQKLFPFRRLEGMANVLKAVKAGFYSDFSKALNLLSENSQQELWTNVDLKQDEKMWLKNILKVHSIWLQ